MYENIKHIMTFDDAAEDLSNVANIVDNDGAVLIIRDGKPAYVVASYEEALGTPTAGATAGATASAGSEAKCDCGGHTKSACHCGHRPGSEDGKHCHGHDEHREERRPAGGTSRNRSRSGAGDFGFDFGFGQGGGNPLPFGMPGGFPFGAPARPSFGTPNVSPEDLINMVPDDVVDAGQQLVNRLMGLFNQQGSETTEEDSGE
jgi:hypothetical protein